MQIAKYLRVFLVQFKNNWVREAVYRTNFLTSLMVDAVWMLVEIGLFTVIYSNTDQLAGWSRDQAYFFLGVFFTSEALFSTFFQRNFWVFSDLVNKGELDTLLTKPVHPLFLTLTRWINISALLNVVLGLVIAAKYAEPAGFQGGWRWIYFGLWLIVGVITQLLLRFAFSIWIFWTERGLTLSQLYYQFYSLATKPDTIYPKMIRYLILTAIPFAFISSVPTRALLHGLSLKESVSLVVVLLFFFIADIQLWNRGLRRYQSASS